MADFKSFSSAALVDLPPDELDYIRQLVALLEEYKRTHKIDDFTPFDYQRRFMAAGQEFEIRYLRAGNRVGKTYGAAAEFAYHLTGLYPDWWKGRRIEDGGHVFWCIGITLDSVSKVIQKELIGTADCRVTELVGTGALPRDCIMLDNGWQPDGARLKQCMIRHTSGKLNTLMFYGAENHSILMGQKVAGIWMDEEPYRSLELYSQCKTRLQNSIAPGVNGILMITATPEMGNTPLNELFDQDETGLLYLQQASLDDNPNYTTEQIDKIMATLPEWQREMRRHGMPVLGNGAVFQFADSLVMTDEITPQPNWDVIAAVDWGKVVDPTVITIGFRDPVTDTYYIYDEIVLDEDEESRSPVGVARYLLNSQWRAVPVVVPHDSGLDSDSNTSNGKLLRRLGVNVLPEPFRNPTDTQLNVIHPVTSGKNVRLIDTGLTEMRYLAGEGRLKVHQRCANWFKEKRGYFYRYNSNTKKMGYAGADHSIDASRYAIMSLMGNRGYQFGSLNYDNPNELKSYSPNLNF